MPPSLFSSTLSLPSSLSALDLTPCPQPRILGDGKTLVSAGERFEMGFFNPGNSRNRYLGIWYYKISDFTVVWVANRDAPLTDSSGELKLTDSGVLVLLNSTNHTIWSTETQRFAQNPVVQLMDSGNLVVKEANDDQNPENFLWRSFDYPGDTFLPGMKLGKNLVTGRVWNFPSWKSNDDPVRGNYMIWVDVRGYPQIFLSNRSVDLDTTGPWNGLRFSGPPGKEKETLLKFEAYVGNEEVFYRYHPIDPSAMVRFVMRPDGILEPMRWFERIQQWGLHLNMPAYEDLHIYNFCGPNGHFNSNKFSVCSCLSNFVPRFPNDWEITDWSGGCVRRTTLGCGNGEGFLKYSDIKLPDTRTSWYNKSMSLQECKEVCLRNYSCTAYSSLDIRNGGSGCLTWFGDLVDIKQFEKDDGQDLYIRMAASELDFSTEQVVSDEKKIKIIIVTMTVLGGILVLGLCIRLSVRRRKKKSKLKKQGKLVHNSGDADNSQKDDLELPLFDFNVVANSTNNFSPENRLGEGGFGPVYKGVLEGGLEVAIKRLSTSSRQGLDEFQNEVVCIAKLQHRNLVKLLGCCIHGDERLLIYEFMPNKSLDGFIFDDNQRTLLDWSKRFHIINGIARGILYLHQDSRLRIIHRDLKASNILLDHEMNPKISDFGTAKSFQGTETEGNTNRVVGTYGYMSPEYIVDGLFSVKSDVFSFGVLVLEIISGRRNRGFIYPDHDFNLLGHAWRLYTEGRPLELIDVVARDSWYLP